MSYLRVLVVLCYLVFSDTAYALRCGHTLIELGDRKYDVAKKCGQPDAIDKYRETKMRQNSINIARNNLSFGNRNSKKMTVVIEEWTYDFGRSRFQQLLRFENGVLTDIENLGRGN